MSSISVARWMKLLAAVSPSSECLYEGKPDVVYLQVTLHWRRLGPRFGWDELDRRISAEIFFCRPPHNVTFGGRRGTHYVREFQYLTH